MDRSLASRIRSHISVQRRDMIALLERLVLVESPSTIPDAQAQILAILLEVLQELELRVSLLPGRRTGGHLLAEAASNSIGNGRQLLLGHCDTVWPIGTLQKMPFSIDGNIARGPGIFDMKGGLTQLVFALKTIRELELKPPLTPVVLVNSDEEIGSVESSPHIINMAKQAKRVYVLEPPLGQTGRLKTARKGVGRFTVEVSGRAAHAGLDPDKGISAILELSHVIQKLFAMNDVALGISVNVGTIEGGMRPNVIAPWSRAVVDVRVPSQADAARVEAQIHSLKPTVAGTTLEIAGGIDRPPLERTRANRKLWRLAKELASTIGLDLEEGMAGGGSDGNTTSQFTATLDGLGSVGDGAHAEHEFIFLDKLVERTTLLTLLLCSPDLSD